MDKLDMEFEVTILYKSGQKMSGWFKKFDVSMKGSEISQVDWVDADPENKVMYLAPRNIEAIWQTGVRSCLKA